MVWGVRKRKKRPTNSATDHERTREIRIRNLSLAKLYENNKPKGVPKNPWKQ